MPLPSQCFVPWSHSCCKAFAAVWNLQSSEQSWWDRVHYCREERVHKVMAECIAVLGFSREEWPRASEMPHSTHLKQHLLASTIINPWQQISTLQMFLKVKSFAKLQNTFLFVWVIIHMAWSPWYGGGGEIESQVLSKWTKTGEINLQKMGGVKPVLLPIYGSRNFGPKPTLCEPPSQTKLSQISDGVSKCQKQVKCSCSRPNLTRCCPERRWIFSVPPKARIVPSGQVECSQNQNSPDRCHWDAYCMCCCWTSLPSHVMGLGLSETELQNVNSSTRSKTVQPNSTRRKTCKSRQFWHLNWTKLTYGILLENKHWPPYKIRLIYTSAWTLQLNNRRIIGCLISFIRSAGFNS